MFDGQCFNIGSGVEVTEIENGYHYTSKSSSSNYITFKKNNQTLFLSQDNPFNIEFDFETTSLIGVYLTKNDSNTYYGISYGYSGVNHVLLEYTISEVSFYLNETLIHTREVDFEDSLIGFNITDWQSDIDCKITNFKIYQNQ